MPTPLLPGFLPTPETISPPVRGKTSIAREAGESGRDAAAVTFGAKQRKLLLWLSRGPMSRQRLSEATGIPINAVCSCLDALIKAGEVESNGDFEYVAFSGQRQTKRERFRITR